MSASIKLVLGFGMILSQGCASREYDVYAKSDAKEQVAVSIDLCKPDGSQLPLFYTELNDDLSFRFRRRVKGENPQVVAKFWVKDYEREPLVVALEPDRMIKFDIDVKDGRVELNRDDKPISGDKD